MEKTLHNGTILKSKSSDYFKVGAAFQRFCTSRGIDKSVSLAMYIIGDPIRPHYHPSNDEAIEFCRLGFSILPQVIEL